VSLPAVDSTDLLKFYCMCPTCMCAGILPQLAAVDYHRMACSTSGIIHSNGSLCQFLSTEHYLPAQLISVTSIVDVHVPSEIYRGLDIIDLSAKESTK